MSLFHYFPSHSEEKPEASPRPVRPSKISPRLCPSSRTSAPVHPLPSVAPSVSLQTPSTHLRAFVSADLARKNLPDSCTGHSSLYLGPCSNVTIREPSLTLLKSSPLPMPLSILLTSLFFSTYHLIHSFIHPFTHSCLFLTKIPGLC